MNENEEKQLLEKVKQEATDAVKKVAAEVEKKINDQYGQVMKGAMTKKEFDDFMEEHIAKVNEVAAKQSEQLDKIEAATKAQGEKINALIEKPGRGQEKTLADVITDNIDKIKAIHRAGAGIFQITGADLKAAGVTSIGGSILPTDNVPDSPYLPGLGGTALELFGIVHPENFIMSKVSIGRTNASLLAWIDEMPMEGAVGVNIPESGLKPLVQHKFKVRLSEAKKAAAHQVLTKEFADDVPGLYDDVRNLLRNDVLRAFDDQLQAGIQAAARPYNINGLNDVQDANLWDALLAMITQVGYYNFQPNAAAVNWITDAKMKTQKNINGSYLTPSFMNDLERMLVRANKIETGNALVGGLDQYQVKVLEDLVIDIGWINEQYIHNQFTMRAEIRYHDYISENRKNALVYDNLGRVKSIIEGAASSS